MTKLLQKSHKTINKKANCGKNCLSSPLLPKMFQNLPQTDARLYDENLESFQISITKAIQLKYYKLSVEIIIK